MVLNKVSDKPFSRLLLDCCLL